MAYTTMSKQQREICEFLALNPHSTNAEICTATGFTYESVKKKLRVLKESGHVKASESRYRSLYELTGKSFPRSADYRPNPRYLARKNRLATRVLGNDTLFAVMHAMVAIGRVPA
jgi:predicted transcriptional regulator